MNALAIIPTDEEPPLGLDIPKGQTFEEWCALGRRLCSGARVMNWWIGDWWAAGSHRYGERAKAAASGIFGKEFQTLMGFAYVSRAFPTFRRRKVLSYTHHAEVAALSPEEADELLARAERESLSSRELRMEVMRYRGTVPVKRQIDIIDVRPPEPPCADFLTPDEIIVELATLLGKERALSDRESGFLEKAVRRIEVANGVSYVEPWTGEQDFAVITMMREGKLTGAEIAKQLGRTDDALWSRVRYLRRKGLLERPNVA